VWTCSGENSLLRPIRISHWVPDAIRRPAGTVLERCAERIERRADPSSRPIPGRRAVMPDCGSGLDLLTILEDRSHNRVTADSKGGKPRPSNKLILAGAEADSGRVPRRRVQTLA